MIHTYDPYLQSIPMIHIWGIASVGDTLVLFLNCICSRIPKFVLPHVFWGWDPLCLASAYLPTAVSPVASERLAPCRLQHDQSALRFPFNWVSRLGVSTSDAPLPWAQSSWFTVPYHTITRSFWAVRKTKQAAHFCKLGSISFHTPFHTRSIPVPCLNHAMWNSSPYLNHSDNLCESYFYK